MPGTERARDQMARAKKRRPEDRRTYRRGGLRVACPCRREEMRLVLETEEPVVVREIDVVIEREGTHVREIVEAVALQPGAELQLEPEPHGEQGREEQGRALPSFPVAG